MRSHVIPSSAHAEIGLLLDQERAIVVCHSESVADAFTIRDFAVLDCLDRVDSIRGVEPRAQDHLIDQLRWRVPPPRCGPAATQSRRDHRAAGPDDDGLQ